MFVVSNLDSIDYPARVFHSVGIKGSQLQDKLITAQHRILLPCYEFECPHRADFHYRHGWEGLK